MWTSLPAPVTLLVRSGFYKTTTLRRPNRRRLGASLETCTPAPEFPNLRTTMLPYAAAQCLRDIMNNAHGWWTYNVPGLSYGETRSVQFIDAIRQLDPHFNLGEIQAEAKGVVKKTIVEKAVVCQILVPNPHPRRLFASLPRKCTLALQHRSRYIMAVV